MYIRGRWSRYREVCRHKVLCWQPWTITNKPMRQKQIFRKDYELVFKVFKSLHWYWRMLGWCVLSCASGCINPQTFALAPACMHCVPGQVYLVWLEKDIRGLLVISVWWLLLFSTWTWIDRERHLFCLPLNHDTWAFLHKWKRLAKPTTVLPCYILQKRLPHHRLRGYFLQLFAELVRLFIARTQAFFRTQPFVFIRGPVQALLVRRRVQDKSWVWARNSHYSRLMSRSEIASIRHAVVVWSCNGLGTAGMG